MAANYFIAKSAAQEIEAIVLYQSTERMASQTARNFIEEFKRQLELTCALPKSHPICPHSELAARGYRSFRIGRYLAIYSFGMGRVRILHVFHQSQSYVADVVGNELAV